MQSVSVLVVAAVLAGTSTAFSGDGTDYGGNVNGGACGFTKDWPTWTPTSKGLTAAINAPQWNDALECGRCAKVQHGSNTPVIVQIVDKCPECKQGDLDFASGAYKAIIQKPPGREKISWEFVDCPAPFVSGTVSLRVKEGSNPTWLAVNPNNFKQGIRGLDISVNGGAYTPMDHDQSIVGLYYKYQGARGSSFKVRVKGMNGQALEKAFTSIDSGSLDMGAQFSGGGSSGGGGATTPSTTSSPSTTSAPSTTTRPSTPSSTTKTRAPTPSTQRPSNGGHSYNGNSFPSGGRGETVRPPWTNGDHPSTSTSTPSSPSGGAAVPATTPKRRCVARRATNTTSS